MAVKRRWLTRDIVVETAVKMANDHGGVRDLTLAAVARELDVRTPSLYNHVDGIEDLQYGMALYGLRQLIDAIQRETVGLAGRQALVAAAMAYRRFVQQQPGVYPLTVRAPGAEEEELLNLAQQLLQLMLLLLASMGLENEEALHAVRGLRAILHGFVSLEAAEGFKLALDREESFRRLVSSYLDGLERRL